MKKVLKLTFKNSEGKTNVITISNPKEDLTAETVKDSMQKIADSKAFVQAGVELYASVEGAHYYTTQSDAVFDAE